MCIEAQLSRGIEALSACKAAEFHAGNSYRDGEFAVVSNAFGRCENDFGAITFTIFRGICAAGFHEPAGGEVNGESGVNCHSARFARCRGH